LANSTLFSFNVQDLGANLETRTKTKPRHQFVVAQIGGTNSDWFCNQIERAWTQTLRKAIGLSLFAVLEIEHDFHHEND
jgi:hypothetical protein